MNSRSKYVIDTFRQLYGVPDEVNIFHGNRFETDLRGVYIPNRGNRFFTEQEALDHTAIIFKMWRNTSLPFLFEDSDSSQILSRQENRIVINYDILSAAFYFLSGWQEYTADQRDEHGRFPFQQSLQYSLSAPHIPFVNYYFDILKTAVEEVYKVELEPSKVQEASHTLVLSHDIDSLYSGWLQDGYHDFKNGEVGEVARILLNKIKGNDPWFNIEEILEFEARHGVSSTFFFLPVQGEQNGIPHADYSMEDSAVEDTLRLVHESGSEIAIHGDFKAHCCIEAITASIRKINRPLQGNRFHYLMYDIHKTPGILSQSGLTYDSTLGFSDHIGFRNGYCHSFYLYDIDKDAPTDILEIPLAIMDTTLYHEKYMGLSPGEAISKIEPLLQQVKMFNGAVSILWHNSYFSDGKYRGWKSVLAEIIKSTQAAGGLVTKAETIIPTFKRAE